jgi:hypothetical protein
VAWTGCGLAVWLFAFGIGASPTAAQTTIKVAYWNIKSGWGKVGLPGHPVRFANTSNCTDATQPLNAWGVGSVQQELRAALGGPSTIALGLQETWLCGSAENVRKALGWAARTSTKNGVALVARYGLAGPERWLQLDTSLNSNPADTMWVLRVPVCVDAGCTSSLAVYVAHWYGDGPSRATTYARQARQTATFLQATANGDPHVLGGDLNVWEEPETVCGQTAVQGALDYLSDAGYLDAWPTRYGTTEGYTGMTNRPGCGSPEGYVWKRIDYVWSRPDYRPLAIQRFGVVPAGDPSPSDHFGLIATFPHPGPPAGGTEGRDIVLYARHATRLTGTWRIYSDATAAGGARVGQLDAGVPKLASPLASPTNYFELTFHPEPGQPYHLWVRGRAQNNYWGNDSAFAQFSGSVTAQGAPIYRIGTTSATTVYLEDCIGCGVSGWGWQDNGYGTNVLGPAIYFNSTTQTLRIQQREDGYAIDQIVLSPVTYMTRAPGGLKNDTVILTEQDGR